MFATDPLSLLFLACFVFAGAFLVLSSLTGLGHGHMAHPGGAAGHAGTGHVAHAGAPHAGHTGTAHAGHATHAGRTGRAAHTGTAPESTAPPWTAITGVLQGSLNLYGVLIFLLAFGLLGYLLRNIANFSAVASLVFAGMVGVAAAVTLSAFLGRLARMSTPSVLTHDSSRLEGRLGTITATVRPGGIGEVLFPGATGGRQSIGARSHDGEMIPVGTEVVILSYRDGIASVQPWDRFMANVRAGTAPHLDPLDIPH